MALKRLETGIKRSDSVGLKRVGAGIQKKLPPLSVPDVDDLLKNVDEDADVGEQVETISAEWQAVRDARVREQKEKELQNDGAFYAVLIFDTRDQKMAFLKGLGMADGGDIYVDGREVVQKTNGLIDEIGTRIKRLVAEKFHDAIDKITKPYIVNLPMVDIKMPKLFRVDKKYGAMALKKGERG